LTTTVDEIEAWLRAKSEDEHLEFKEAKQQFDTVRLMRYCVGIANEGGGRIVLGVTDALPRRVVGSQAYPDLQDVASKLFAKLRFRVDVEEVHHPNGRVVVFHIPSRPAGTAYAYEGAYVVRSTEDLVPMSEDRLRRIFAEGKPDWLNEAGCTGTIRNSVYGGRIEPQPAMALVKRSLKSTAN
jgi:ATP-dependent DNA helicase RecG